MSYIDLLSGLSPATAGLTSAHKQVLSQLIVAGDRGGFYLAYYEMLKQFDPVASGVSAAALAAAQQQVLMQAHISTYSGFLGGAALIGNAIAKFSEPTLYLISLDEFSLDIADALQDAVDGVTNGFIDANTIQNLDRGVWDSKGLGDYFPGNFQLMDDDYRNLLTAGTVATTLTGLEQVFGARVGFESDDYGGSSIFRAGGDFEVKFDTSGKVVWVQEHVGLVDDLLPYSPSGSLDEPTLALIAPFVAAIEFPLLATFAALPFAYLAYNNEAFATAVGALLEGLTGSIGGDADVDFGLRNSITSYVGAGRNFLIGGSGNDTAFYEGVSSGQTLEVSFELNPQDGNTVLQIKSTDVTDRVIGVEKVELSSFADALKFYRYQRVARPAILSSCFGRMAA